jgi:mannosyl-3-phosphoglycerate phosphatase family protein
MAPPSPIVVFSNADAALFEPREPAFEAAGQLLQQLRPENVALVLCSSQTRAELEFTQQMLGIQDPFISEHGAAVFIPDRYFPVRIPGARDLPGYHTVEFGRPYADVVDALHQSAKRLRIEIAGFNDLSIETVARECGVPLLQARLAKLRDYEERFRVLDPNPAAFDRLSKALQAARLRAIRAEPFHYAGGPVDHSHGARLLKSLYRRVNDAVLPVAVVDAPNGSSLASLADHRILVDGRRRGGRLAGVVGWAEAIVEAVHDLRATGTLARAVSGREND